MANKHRKLATIQRIGEVDNVQNADRLEKVSILGWDVVIGKGQVEEGDLVVYFEIDSFLPIDERYAFLKKTSLRVNQLHGEGIRIKTVKLRGQVSQGLAIPLSEFPEITDTEVGTDLTEQLGVKLWEVPERYNEFGLTKDQYYSGLSKTDEMRGQSEPERLQALTGHPYYITEKIDGMSVSITYDHRDGVRIFGRKQEILYTKGSALWQFFIDSGMVDALKEHNHPMFFQGELFGPKIQSNRLKVNKTEWRWFNVGELDPSTQHLPYVDWREKVFDVSALKPFADRQVNILETGTQFNYTLEELQELSQGNYHDAGQREGIVIRPQVTLLHNSEPLSFKVINNKYLLKHDE